jgi:hypothetical protein
MQLFLLGFIIIEICEIFTVGGFPLHDAVRKVGMVFRGLVETPADECLLGIFGGAYRCDYLYLLGSAHERAGRLPAT